MPDSVQMMQRYTCRMDGNYALELRASSSTFADDPLGSSRLVYVNGPHEPGNCRPAYSLDLNMLVQRGEVYGLTSDTTSIYEAARAADSEQREEAAFLHQLFALMQRHELNEPLESIEVQELEFSFTSLLKRGAIHTAKHAARTHEDGTKVGLGGSFLEGPLQHAWSIEREWPRIRMGVQKAGDKNHTILEETSEGELESYEEIANFMQRYAAIVGEDNVVRDDQGNIIMVKNVYDSEQAVMAAERAMGLRDLHPAQVELVGHYLEETFHK